MSSVEEKRTTEEGDDEFMNQVNVYLQSSTGTRESSKELEGLLARSPSINKVVKFAIDEDEEEEAGERSRQDLLTKIDKLTGMLREAEQQISEEKDKRKKKEKNLMKLAKELKKRNTQREKDLEKMEEMEEKKKYLEHHWILAQKELDQEKVLREKQQIESKEEFDRAVADEKEKYVRVEKDHEQRIADLKKAHAKQCDELCREILKANLEADRLHSQLKDNGVEPRKARLFTEGTSTGPNLPLIPIIGAVVLLVLVFLGLRVEMFSRHALCNPIRPGRVLSELKGTASYQAPWWAPTSSKEQAYRWVCSADQPPPVLDWSSTDGKEHKLVVSQGGKPKFNKKSVTKAEVFGSGLKLSYKKGIDEEQMLAWASKL